MKNKLTSKKIIKQLERKKNNKKIKDIGVRKIGLFGSFSKNKDSKNSDIDILVKFDKINFDNYFALLVFLEKIFQRKVDLVIENDLKPELKYIKKEAEYVKI